MKKLKDIKGSKHFAKKFGSACGDFDIVNNDGVDHFLIPVDLDYPHQTLLYWMYYKTTKIPKHFKITAVHFYSTDTVNEETNAHFIEICNKINVPYKTKKVESPSSKAQYIQILADSAVENQCNKIAIPDSLDYLNAYLLTNMATAGIFSGIQITQKIDTTSNGASSEVLLARPFCYASDEDIKNFALECDYVNKPTGISVSEEPYMAIARKGIEQLISDYSNVRMNFFHSQFSIQKKYIGIGEDKVLENPEDDFD